MPDELPDFRTIINQTALEVIDVKAGSRPRIIAERASVYVKRLRAQQPQLTQAEADKALEGLVSGILRRLEEIASGGGQIGSA